MVAQWQMPNLNSNITTHLKRQGKPQSLHPPAPRTHTHTPTAGEHKSFTLGHISPLLLPFLSKYADGAERQRRLADSLTVRKWDTFLTMPVRHRWQQIHSNNWSWRLQHPPPTCTGDDELSASFASEPERLRSSGGSSAFWLRLTAEIINLSTLDGDESCNFQIKMSTGQLIGCNLWKGRLARSWHEAVLT